MLQLVWACWVWPQLTQYIPTVTAAQRAALNSSLPVEVCLPACSLLVQSRHCRYQCCSRWCWSSVLDGSQNNPCTRSSSRPCFPWSHSSRTAGHAVDVSLFSKDTRISQSLWEQKRSTLGSVWEEIWAHVSIYFNHFSASEANVKAAAIFNQISPPLFLLLFSFWKKLSHSPFNLPVHAEHSLSHTHSSP